VAFEIAGRKIRSLSSRFAAKYSLVGLSCSSGEQEPRDLE
jgi:hypothetical protein